ncbi:MAG: iron-siderophore ABC transporter substrate-binding protein [Cyanobacteria bacterium P01_F01_bin.116]
MSPSSPHISMRTINHAMGSTDIPAAPERVVVLDYAPLDTALALDLVPIGTTEVPISPIYPEVINDITVVGKGQQPNLETILKLKPDLILGSKISAEKWYRQLSEIAPTILTEDNGRDGSWKENFRLYANVLGQPDQAEQLLDDYQQRINALQSKLEQPLKTMTVSVITHWSGGVLAYSADSFSGSVLQDIGFERNPYQGKGKRYGISLSREELSAIDGDILFLMYRSTNDYGVTKTEFVSDPLWSTLNVVEQGIVCEVDSTTWSGGRSILAANQILADVELCLFQSN